MRKTNDLDYVWYSYPNEKYPLIEKGEGVFLFDELGNRYFDASSGALVVNIGHGVKKVAEAMKKQAETLTYLSRTHFINKPLLEFARKIGEMAPGDLNKVLPVSGGSEAIEVAIKLARKYFVESKMVSKYKIISRWNSYHGNTIAGLSLSGRPAFRNDYIPLLLNIPHIPPAYCYRCPFDREYPNCEIMCAHYLEYIIKQEGPGNIAAFIAEPIGGATMGAVVPPKEYYGIIREICDKYEVVMIMDEVMTGIGRTGKNFAIEHWNVIPDIIVFAKGVSGGYAPLGGIVARDKFYQKIKDNSGSFLGGYTYGGNPLSVAVGVAALNYISENNLVSRSEEMGKYFFNKLEVLFKHPTVGDIRGKGLMIGVEFVKNRKTKEPFDSQVKYYQRVTHRAFSKGLILYSGSGFVDGGLGDHILIGPPFIITKEQIDEIVGILDETLSELEDDLHSYIDVTSLTSHKK